MIYRFALRTFAFEAAAILVACTGTVKVHRSTLLEYGKRTDCIGEY